MRALQPVKGTHDILPEDMRRFRAVFDKAREVAARYGYREMATPIFEFTEVFKRTLGDTSDVVTKEMYTFDTKGGEQVTLRPEATAGVARAFISGGLAQQLPLKFFFAGPMFRHERPQAGRQRQFHQIDIELLGVPQPLGDVDIIAAGAAILDALGVRDKTTLELNTLGDPESRKAYREALVAYFRDHEAQLSEDSRMRLARNPLRILDSKDEGDRALVAGAPHFADYLNPASVDFFDEVKAGLDALGIAYQLNPRLVRGLDYYTHTAFEFTTTALGAQGAVLAGGRYDYLIEQLGGPPTAGTGWAAGVERLVLLMAAELPELRPLAVVPLGAEAERAALALTERLRREGFTAELGFSGNMKKRLSRANKMKARAALILGEEELAKESITLRDLDSGEQELVPLAALSERLARFG
ncbi:MAG: histidine--tRNA ligase [Kiloniellales bacterium]|nr:histidine--tRNA ligase [Kiloniellales bacterium]MDJ0972508.1 histidine--tRNA ligase [Kiloniellales bacterium]MDJ0981829.1 histidine--tRNA ligase [Kiloniellales bacterium]